MNYNKLASHIEEIMIRSVHIILFLLSILFILYCGLVLLAIIGLSIYLIIQHPIYGIGLCFLLIISMGLLSSGPGSRKTTLRY